MIASEIKALTGARRRAVGEDILYRQLAARTWMLNGHAAHCAGYDRRKDLVHFCATWGEAPGVVGHRRVGLSLGEALSNETGILDAATILH